MSAFEYSSGSEESQSQDSQISSDPLNSCKLVLKGLQEIEAIVLSLTQFLSQKLEHCVKMLLAIKQQKEQHFRDCRHEHVLDLDGDMA